MEELEGKVAVVTGGASGIGLATARRLAAQGMRIMLADVEAERLAVAVAELTEAGAEVDGTVCDVAERDSVVALADATWAAFGGCHVLFNNAGVAVFGEMRDMSHDDWRWVIDVDLWGPIHGVEVFVPRMVEQGQGGHVINTASFAGLVPNHGLGAYCVAKYGVVALSECLRFEMKPHDIGVSVVCPMRVMTDIDGSHRNRQTDYGGEVAGRGPAEPPPEETFAGDQITADDAADLIVRAVQQNVLYVHTHRTSQEIIRRRFDRIDRAFDELGVE
ncbi:MAG: SDR family NAD(P)-dependent oxidoreductase [Actinomycetota bacterium]